MAGTARHPLQDRWDEAARERQAAVDQMATLEPGREWVTEPSPAKGWVRNPRFEEDGWDLI